MYTDELLSTQRNNILTSIVSKFESEKSEGQSNLIPDPECLSVSAVLVNFIARNKQFLSVKWAFKYCDHVANS